MKNRVIALFLVCCMVFSLVACGNAEQTAGVGGNSTKVEGSSTTDKKGAETNSATTKENNSSTVVEKEENTSTTPEGKVENLASSQSAVNCAPIGEYNKGVVLVKVKESFNKKDLGALAYTSAEALYKSSNWYVLSLVDADKTEEAVTYLTELDTFEKVDYDYVMGVTGPKEDAENNPNFNNQVNLGLSNIPHGWTQNGKAPGGSPNVIVAVIDTGVDYNHPDLRNNIWTNTAEIPDNGKDDDKNGYIDDVYGWDCVANDKDPMDDNGHGTHVAGIIAAENNKEGGIGVAYNCKVMVLKAGNSSGYFNNSDIAEAIQYAYMNGASVINMSFGGSQISFAVEEALENAYNSCVLVAAAGNDGACNNLACPGCLVKKVSYPAALPYVIGVMSTDKNGSHISSFSNYDHYPYDSIEYEVYAVGEGVGSTWPSNKYACLNGTSMAAPTVAGIAALLRSYYSDREMYSTKFIQSQIVNTGTICLDGAHTVADVQAAMTKSPKPSVNLYDYYIDDSTTISSANNGNGVIDAGETVRLYLSLHNRGGVASNVNVSIDTYRSEIGDETMTDPYFTFVNPTIQLSDIGTYSVRESGDKYFKIIISADCPNDYLVDFNIRFTYTNGMDKNDNTTYKDDGNQKAQFNVSRGFLLPAIIDKDTVYKADKLYIVGQDVIIPEDVTVTFEEGCRIQFYDDREYYNSPSILVHGTLKIAGTKENMVEIYPSERYPNFTCSINRKSLGWVNISYASATNLVLDIVGGGNGINLYNSHLRVNESKDNDAIFCYEKGDILVSGHQNFWLAKDCYIELTNYSCNNTIRWIENCYVVIASNLECSLDCHTLTNSIIATKIAGNSPYDKQIHIVLEATNNIFTIPESADLTNFIPIWFYNNDFNDSDLGLNLSNNEFSPLYQKYASQVIKDYYGQDGEPILNVYSSIGDASKLWPYVVSIELFDKDGVPIAIVGKEEFKVRVTFNRPMDTSKNTYVSFGSIEPYADYKITGTYVSDTVWEGTYTLKSVIENGQNFLKVNNACAAEDQSIAVFGEHYLSEFTVDTATAMAMNLQAVATNKGIELTFAQDDYDTLLGYNIYRSEEKDGNFVRLNRTIILPEETTFLDDNTQPGKTYWYTYTVVLSDLTESKPAGKVQAAAADTIAPSLYHTPVNQGYMGNNLIISCTASDNIQIATVTLYYRTVGSDTWKSLSMSKLNDRYSATIFGSELNQAGLQYYIVASDGLSMVSRGTATTPYKVVIKDVASISYIGDVDGNGQITTKDALMLMQCLNGDLILTDDAFKRADLNSNGQLSSAEALRILQYVNGKLTTLAM